MIGEVLEMLPDEHAIAAIRLEDDGEPETDDDPARGSRRARAPGPAGLSRVFARLPAPLGSLACPAHDEPLGTDRAADGGRDGVLRRRRLPLQAQGRGRLAAGRVVASRAHLAGPLPEPLVRARDRDRDRLVGLPRRRPRPRADLARPVGDRRRPRPADGRRRPPVRPQRHPPRVDRGRPGRARPRLPGRLDRRLRAAAPTPTTRRRPWRSSWRPSPRWRSASASSAGGPITPASRSAPRPGLFWAVSDTAIKAQTGVFGQSLVDVFVSPLVLLIIVASFVGLTVSAKSLQIGKAVPVIAMTTVAANALTIASGPIVFGDPVPDNSLGVAARIAAFVLVLGAAALTPAPVRAAEAQ